MIRKLLVVTFALALGGETNVEPDLTPDYYDTVQDAAVAAIQLSYDRSSAYEYGGIILRTTNGKFRFSQPETSYRGDGLHIEYNNDFMGYDVVADYHTHPCLPYSHWPAVFSDGDANSSDVNDIVGYMGDLCSGVIRQYVPGTTERDMCWQHDGATLTMAALAHINLCGAHGKEIGSIRITKQPIIQEIPGPITKARGYNCW